MEKPMVALARLSFASVAHSSGVSVGVSVGASGTFQPGGLAPGRRWSLARRDAGRPHARLGTTGGRDGRVVIGKGKVTGEQDGKR